MIKKEILDYVMNTPGNTNYSVLKSLLDREGGGASSVLVCNVVKGDYGYRSLDKTWQEIVDALLTGVPVYARYDESYEGYEDDYSMVRIQDYGYSASTNTNYYVMCRYNATSSDRNAWFCDTPDGYPGYSYD